MATLITPQLVEMESLEEVVLVGATADMNYPNSFRELLLVTTGATPTQLTIHSVPCEHGRSGDIVLAIAALKTFILGLLPVELFNDSEGLVNLTFTVTTDVKVAALKLGAN